MSTNVVITGSTQGIGRALAAELAKRGHAVVVSGRKQETVDAAVADLRSDGRGRRPRHRRHRPGRRPGPVGQGGRRARLGRPLDQQRRRRAHHGLDRGHRRRRRTHHGHHQHARHDLRLAGRRARHDRPAGRRPGLQHPRRGQRRQDPPEHGRLLRHQARPRPVHRSAGQGDQGLERARRARSAPASWSPTAGCARPAALPSRSRPSAGSSTSCSTTSTTSRPTWSTRCSPPPRPATRSPGSRPGGSASGS